MSYTGKRWAAVKRANLKTMSLENKHRRLARDIRNTKGKQLFNLAALPVSMAHDGANVVGKGIKKSYKAISGFKKRKNN